MSDVTATLLAQHRVPTIEVSGTAVRQQAPKLGVISVSVSVKAPTQVAVWAKFQDLCNQLREAIGTFGTVGNSMPTESSEEVSRGLRSGVEYTARDTIEVEFSLANYGEILQALVNCGLPISTPRFTYDDLPKVTPDLLAAAAAAAAAAKANAEGVAAGIQGRIGRLVSINVGPPCLKTVYRSSKEIERGFPNFVSLLSQNMSFSTAILEEKLKTYDTEVQVTVEYEVILNSNLSELA